MKFISTSLIFGLVLATSAYANDFTLKTRAFSPGGAFPVLYTCDGRDISPELTWLNPPAKTKSYALILTDPDAPSGTWYHWVIYNIPGSTSELSEGITTFPKDTLLGQNSWGKLRYNGPCPPKGTHHYIFTLYALDAPLNLPSGATAEKVIEATKQHVLGQALLSTVYAHQ